jgi:hypothetical protein
MECKTYEKASIGNGVQRDGAWDPVAYFPIWLQVEDICSTQQT